MQLGDKLAEYIKNFSSYRTTMDFGDVAEILIIAVLLYYALVGIAQGSGCHPHFFAVGLFFPYDYHPVDGPECPGLCGDSPHSGATAGIEKGIGGTGQEEYYQFCITF